MISYTLNVTGIKKITQANIRNGSQGENGDILVVLSKSESAKGDDRPPKIGFGGKITKDDLTGPLKGKELSDLISLMSKGNAYANIQTEKYPKGAIRAQIASEIGAISNETLTPTGNATNATTTTNETTSALTPPPTMEQPPAVDMNATNATTTTNETTSALTPPPTMEQPPAVDMNATNATTTTNETTSALTPPPTMEQPPLWT